MPVLPGGIPNIRTLAHIDIVLGRLPAWRGKQRVRVLERCERRLSILHQAGAINAVKLAAYREKVLRPLAVARQQQVLVEQQEARERAAELERLAAQAPPVIMPLPYQRYMKATHAQSQ